MSNIGNATVPDTRSSPMNHYRSVNWSTDTSFNDYLVTSTVYVGFGRIGGRTSDDFILDKGDADISRINSGNEIREFFL